MNQENLFHETPEDAMGAVISACGGFKRVAGLLWPTRKPESAYARLKACLDDSKDEKLTLSEVVEIARMGREAGAHAFLNYLCRELDYSPVKPIAPHDSANQRMDEIRKSLELIEKNQRLVKAHVEALSRLESTVKSSVSNIHTGMNRRA